MAIVVLTDFAWPDVDFERELIEAAGHTLVAGSSVPAPANEIEALIANADPAAIMTCWAEISSEAIARPSCLRIVQRLGVGLDNIAVPAATARGAWVANVPDYCVEEVSDHALAMTLDWARGVSQLDRTVKQGEWNPASAALRRVADLTIGIIGFGRIGRRTAAKLQPFGCRIVAHTRTPVPSVECLSLEALLEQCDVVILHIPLTPETFHIIDPQALARMKPGALLVNVSRGSLVDTDALIGALEAGHLSGAGLDVVEDELQPPRALVDRSDVVVTPHVAFSSNASLLELRRRATEEVLRVLDGRPPLNACNELEMPICPQPTL